MKSLALFCLALAWGSINSNPTTPAPRFVPVTRGSNDVQVVYEDPEITERRYAEEAAQYDYEVWDIYFALPILYIQG